MNKSLQACGRDGWYGMPSRWKERLKNQLQRAPPPVRPNPTSPSCLANAPSHPQEKLTLKLDFPAEGIYGGALVGVRSGEFIVFYDWDGNIVRRIDVAVKTVHWSEVSRRVRGGWGWGRCA